MVMHESDIREAKERVLSYLDTVKEHTLSEIIDNKKTKNVRTDAFYIQSNHITIAVDDLIESGEIMKDWKPTEDGGHWIYYKKE